MKFTKVYIFILFTLFSYQDILAQQEIIVESPNKKIKVIFGLSNNGEPYYKAYFNNNIFIDKSNLGFKIKETGSGKAFPLLANNFRIINTKAQSNATKWQPILGEVKTIEDNHNSILVSLQQQGKEDLILNLFFKVFNDGLGFRYEFPKQKNLDYFIVDDELTQFNLSNNCKAFWIPGDFDTNEYQPQTTFISKINSLEVANNNPEISVKSPINDSAVQTPLMLKNTNNLYINIHEAALINYPVMNIEVDRNKFILKSVLVPDAIGNKAYLQTPCATPWRTIVVSDKATDILASKLILNLNEPSKIKNTNFIKPSKFVGVWWQMHVGIGSWDLASGKHAANTKNVKKYIDFASKHGLDGVLVEGWNEGWEDWFGKWKENVFDFITPYKDFDLKGLQKYAKQKKVKLIMHHETSGSVSNYERQLDTAFRLMKKHGYETVKTGYVGKIIPRGEHHDGQSMVNHYIHVADKAAKYNIMIDAHEPVRPTGLHRTYPNWLACEAARGMEFNAWSKGNKPNHETILPFTRLMGGPMDYTPGIFELNMSYWDKSKTQIINTTLAKQLALYVVFYSPLQMAADLPESYEKRLDAFKFIKDVAIDWDDTKYLEAEPGEYITVARKAKNKNNWFIGAITNENTKTTTIELNFLDDNATYEAIIYADAENISYLKNADRYTISKKLVTSKDSLTVNLASGGGCAISLIKK